MTSALLLFSSIALQNWLSFAQDFTPSSSWRKPNITLSVSDRISLADAAIQVGLNSGKLNITTFSFSDGAKGFGTPGAFLSQMAEFDLATNQTKYKDQLLTAFSTVSSRNPNFVDPFPNFGLLWGYAAMKAYKAYKDPVFLDYAQKNWEYGNNYTLSDDQVKSGSTPVKTFPIIAQCQGFTMAGGTFWQTGASEPTISSLSTGYFLIVSALLAEATSNQTYLTAAKQAADFIHAHLFTVDNIVQENIFARSSDSCGISTFAGPSAFAGPRSSGLFMEGLAILANLTGDNDRLHLLRSSVSGAVMSRLWQGDDGVLAAADTKIGDMHFMRGLIAAFTRTSGRKDDADMDQYLVDYISVQFNAILDQAAVSGSNIYGGSWIGPASQTYQTDNQTVAMTALIGAIYLQASSDSGGGGKDSTSSPIPTPSPSSSLVGPIVGGVVGGLLLLAIIVVLLLFSRRRKQGRRDLAFTIDGANGVSWGSNPLSPYPYSTLNPTELRATGSAALLPLQRGNQSRTATTTSPTTVTLTSKGNSIRMAPSSPSLSGNTNTTSAVPQRELPTSELVRMLNERLQPDRWQTEEVPPEYHPQAPNQ